MEENIIIQEDLVKSITTELTVLRNYQSEYNGIVLYSQDIKIIHIIQRLQFCNKLAVELDNHNLRSYSKEIKIASKESDYVTNWHELKTEHGILYVGVIRLFPQITARFGTLQSPEYILDWTQQTQWNIGRGNLPSERYGVDADNFIIIKDDDQDTNIQYINNHVSSFHAKILYENEVFYIQAEEGGINHTRLKRGKFEQTLRTEIKVPLQDGDFIKLGSVDHFVLLRFKIG